MLFHRFLLCTDALIAILRAHREYGMLCGRNRSAILLGCGMYHPTTRVLAVLDLLQSRGEVSGAELAARLEVSARTIRGYVTMLRDMGIPVEARPGRHGGYRLRPGFRLPPLMLANDEA